MILWDRTRYFDILHYTPPLVTPCATYIYNRMREDLHLDTGLVIVDRGMSH